jgi:uncharacterized protein (DUF488 family)
VSRIFTVGHSTHELERFLKLLDRSEIEAVADVRSMPYSRRQPQYNREAIKATLKAAGVKYLYLGEELGARSQDPECYVDGRVQYGRLAQTDLFIEGLERVADVSAKKRLTLLCAEAEPLECHRGILVSRELSMNGFDVSHILGDGRLETHDDAMSRLLRQFKLPDGDLFRSRDEILDEAYAKQERRIAYVEPRLANQPEGEEPW